MAVDRGEFRGIHVVVMDGPDFQRLSGYARSIWYPTRLATGAAGIAVIPAFEAVTAERAGWSLSDTREAIAELVAQGWLEVERNVVWVVRGLELEPSLKVENPNHREHIANTLASLPRLAIVDRFKSRYANWLAGTSLAPAALPPDHPGIDPESIDNRTESDRSLQPPPPPQLPPEPRLVVGDARAREVALAVTTAANAALAAHSDPGVRAEAEAHPLRVDQATQHVIDWLTAGASAETIKSTVRDLAGRFKPSTRSRRISSFAYFDRAVRATLAAPAPNGKAPKPPLAKPRTL